MGMSIQVLLVVIAGRVFGKYVLVDEMKTWTDAQQHCRQYYTELAPVSGPEDNLKLKEVAGGSFPFSYNWIGLYREANNLTDWKWSGGRSATYLKFQPGQPNNYQYERYCSVGDSGWYNSWNRLGRFFCLNWFVVGEPKTWEEALEFCREQHTDLTSLLSETELVLAQREIQRKVQTTLVWTGLRFLGDRWLWVNGDRLDYQAWPSGGGYQCPASNLRCGAVGTAGPWVAHDCQERLNFICY